MRALKEVDGVATRQSATLDHITYYAARRLPDGSVLRVAIRQDTVYAAYFSLIPYILIFLVLIGSGCFSCNEPDQAPSSATYRDGRLHACHGDQTPCDNG